MRHLSKFGTIAAMTAAVLTIGPGASANGHREATLEGRAVLPVATYAPGPPAGAAMTSIRGIKFPTKSQPVEGFSAVIDGRRPGEFLAMPDNGFGSKANSYDFLIRAYYVRPHFKTADGGNGRVEVALGNFISFRDPKKLIGFKIQNEATRDRLLTGADIDPESLQRADNGDYWMGEEFGPWILHFSPTGVLLDPPFAVPGGVLSPNNPAVLAGTATATHPNSRGIEAMAISPDGRYLYAALEGPTNADKADPKTTSRRHIFEFSIRGERFTGRTWEYKTEQPDDMVADMAALDGHRLLLIERDGGSGVNAVFRGVYVVDRDVVRTDGYLASTRVVDLAAVADPDRVSLPPIHAGDVGLGNPFRVACESVEAIHPLDDGRILIGCDNNFPNAGRNPDLADDNEFVVIRVPGLGDRHDD